MRPFHAGICEQCGVPAIWAKDSVLDADNTSLQKVQPVRGVFYEVDEISGLLRGMESVLGVSLDRLGFEAHKRAVRCFFEGSLRGLTGKTVAGFMPGFVYRQQAKVARYFGVGTMEVHEYSRGGPLVVMAGDIYDEILFAADVGGAFEAVEDVECDVDIEPRDGGHLITARRREKEREEFRGRLAPVFGALMGDRDYPRCRRCGAPVSFQAFRWDVETGLITEKDNGMRVVHQTVGCVESLLQEMAEELGEEIRALAIRAQANRVRANIEAGAYCVEGADPARRCFEHVGLLRRRCMGNPIMVRLEGDELRVKIRNPASEELIIGRVLGTFEAVTGRRGTAVSDRTEGVLEVSVTPV